LPLRGGTETPNPLVLFGDEEAPMLKREFFSGELLAKEGVLKLKGAAEFVGGIWSEEGMVGGPKEKAFDGLLGALGWGSVLRDGLLVFGSVGEGTLGVCAFSGAGLTTVLEGRIAESSETGAGGATTAVEADLGADFILKESSEAVRLVLFNDSSSEEKLKS
jgi:hypothetical protein